MFIRLGQFIAKVGELTSFRFAKFSKSTSPLPSRYVGARGEYRLRYRLCIEFIIIEK